ncbi:MAG: MFS transporter, partial [Betaproteobacteria bacterium]|nr:MFS transporter [Betaproteobacteria bacterium]
MKHPRLLRTLFFTEMWERFSFYGMRALLVLYLVNAMAYSDTDALHIYGIYTGLVYLTPLIGGYIADKYTNSINAILIGGVLMMVGHALLAFEPLFFIGLGFLIAGNGFFKPNISSMLGNLYLSKPEKLRDEGFSYFYIGINIGAFLAPLVIGFIGEFYSWHLGFLMAALGMFIGLIIFCLKINQNIFSVLIKSMEGLPTYKITIDEAYNDGTEPLGVDAIAFTANPAVLVKGVAFKSQAKSHFADEKKYRITAPAMIPMDIYRRDDEMGEYYVQFTETEIDTIFKDFMLNLNNRNLFNLEHEGDKIVPAYILEAWLVDNPEGDKAKTTFGIDVPKGTLMVTAQVTDTDYYNKLVEAKQVGFSIEGFLGLKLSNQIKTNNMLPEGEHTLEDGTVIVVKDGVVVEVREPETEVAMEVEASTEVEMEAAKEEVVVEEETIVEEVEAAIDPAVD